MGFECQWTDYTTMEEVARSASAAVACLTLRCLCGKMTVEALLLHS